MQTDIPHMYIVKRNGQKQPVQFDKITNRISRLINKDERDKLIPALITQKVISSIYSGIKTDEIDIEAAKICANMVTTHPLYGFLAGRILVSDLHKKTKNSFVDKMNSINKMNPGLLDQEWLKWINNNSIELEKIIDYSRDFKYDYFGFKTLERAYLIKDSSYDEIYERPQDMLLRVASFINMGNLEMTQKTYDTMSNGNYTHASPTLFNSGTSRSQLSSCFLLNTNDSIEGITTSWDRVSKISKWAGGIGLHVSNIRAKGSTIRGTNGPSSGIVPMLQVYNNIARYINQGGKRKGSFAIYLEPHHPDIIDFLELKKNTGSDEVRARDLFYALWVSDLFMKQVEKDDEWYFFCPDQAPGLNDVYGEEYETLYWKYVEEKRYKSIIKARKLMEQIMDAQLETGMPYMLYKDSINSKSNQKNIGVIKSSNLCAEIVEVSNNEEHAVCNLASIAINHALENFKSHRTWTIYTKENCKYCKWAKRYMDSKGFKYIEKTELDDDINKFLNKKEDNFKVTFPQILYGKTYIGGFDEMTKYTADKYNFDKLWDTAYIATVNLNRVIDKNYYPTIETKCSNMRNRPIGLGLQGLADTLARMKVSFESEDAVTFNSHMMETIYHAAISASCNISKERYELLSQIQDIGVYDNISNYYDKNYFVNGKTSVSDTPIDKDNLENNIYHQLRLNKEELSLDKYIGAYSKYEGSPMSEGLFQQDMWDNTKCYMDWNELREKVKLYGVRNSLVTALMPTASTSQIMGNNECFEWFTNNIYTRRTLAGDFPVINKHLVHDLINIGEWNEDVKNIMIADDGSVKLIKNMPISYKNLYKTIWEIKQIWALKNARARGPFVDQTQSMNIFMSVPDYKKLNSCHNWGWKNGLKTGMYYLRTNAAKSAIKFTVDPNLINKINNEDEEECYSCSA
jgi:ribonucleoside-diphosphate reductase subunit M1